MDGPILVLGDPANPVAGSLRGEDDVEVVAEVEACLARATSLQVAGHPARLVAVSPEVPEPFAAGRRIRGLERSIGLAFIVPDTEVRATEAKLGFVPDLSDVVVLASDPPEGLAVEIRRAASRAVQRARVARALDGMNQRLLDVATSAAEPPHRYRGVSERYLAALTRHAPDAIVSTDPEGQVVTVNTAAARILELPHGRTEGQRLEDLIRSDDPEQLHELVGAVSRGELLDGLELWTRRHDDSLMLLSVTAAPVFDDAGTVAGSVFFARDITQQRRTDERLQHLQRSESLATLAGGVAHDFNNLIATIQGWLTLAASDLQDTEVVGVALEHIRTASDRASELARAMLAYGGRTQADPHPCDVSSLVDGMQRLFAASIHPKITVALDLAPDLPEVMADETQLRQVIMNLMTNAAEAIDDEAGTITLGTRHEHRALDDDAGATAEPHGEVVVIEVADSGPGMDEHTATRVFDPFFSTKFAGRGLGLAASLGIVRAHGGDISIDSSPGAGARFRVVLPTSPEDAP